MAQINMEMSEYQELIDTISKLKSENSQLKLDNKSTEDFYRQSIAEEKTKTAEALEGKQISYYTADLNAYRNEINSQMTALYSYIVQKNTNISTYRSKFVEYNIKQIITEITEQISTIRDSVKNKNITLNRKIIGLDEAINVAKNEIYLDYKDSLEKKLVYLNDTIEENKKIREKLESEKNEYKALIEKDLYESYNLKEKTLNERAKEIDKKNLLLDKEKETYKVDIEKSVQLNIEDLKNKLSNSLKDLEVYKKNVSEKENHINDLNCTIEDLTSKISNNSVKHEEEISKLRRELDVLVDSDRYAKIANNSYEDMKQNINELLKQKMNESRKK